MEKNFASLLSLICETRFDYRRVNDVNVSDEELTIQFYDTKDSEGKNDVRICLKDSKKNEYSLSVRQLAGLRIETSEIKCTWLDEFREDAGGSIFQNVARELLEKGKSLETIKFKVVKQLKVKNAQVQGATVPVYKDSCYEGAKDYTKGIRALLKDKTAAFFATAEYSRGMAELREKLHSTPVRNGQDIEKNYVLLPVFRVF